MRSVDEELAEILSRFDIEKKRKVLEYVRTFSEGQKRRGPGPELRALAGILSDEDARQMLEAIEDCRRIDPDDWDSGNNPFNRPDEE